MKYTQDLSNSDMCVNIDFIVQKVHTVILVLLHFGARVRCASRAITAAISYDEQAFHL